jgi:hypothetical protein
MDPVFYLPEKSEKGPKRFLLMYKCIVFNEKKEAMSIGLNQPVHGGGETQERTFFDISSA